MYQFFVDLNIISIVMQLYIDFIYIAFLHVSAYTICAIQLYRLRIDTSELKGIVMLCVSFTYIVILESIDSRIEL